MSHQIEGARRPDRARLDCLTGRVAGRVAGKSAKSSTSTLVSIFSLATVALLCLPSLTYAVTVADVSRDIDSAAYYSIDASYYYSNDQVRDQKTTNAMGLWDDSVRAEYDLVDGTGTGFGQARQVSDVSNHQISYRSEIATESASYSASGGDPHD